MSDDSLASAASLLRRRRRTLNHGRRWRERTRGHTHAIVPKAGWRRRRSWVVGHRRRRRCSWQAVNQHISLPSALSGRARHISPSRGCGGMGKNELSTKENRNNQRSALACPAFSIIQSYRRFNIDAALRPASHLVQAFNPRALFVVRQPE